VTAPSDPSHRAEARGRSLVAIGNFDGVHRGHRAVLAGAARDAKGAGLEPVVLTFEPHPAVVLGRTPPALLTPLDRKIELVHRIDPNIRVVVRTFDRELASSSPARFVDRVLVGDLAVGRVLVGRNFRFGQGRAGDLALLAQLGATHGFVAQAAELVGDEHGPWSSTRAREALARADLAEVERVLGRPHALTGAVVEGDRRGRTIGFPTANLGGVAEALPPFGVYAVLVDRLDAAGRATAFARGVANVGVRPTVGAGPSTEAHLFDFDGDLYGARLRLHLVSRLRPEKKFSGLDELKGQIARDADAARALLADRAPDPAAGGAWY
jgi:riboflavin kinase/FMN adenylyltransferase